MSDVRRMASWCVLAMALGAALFGVVRGLSKTGPASGVRMIVAITPPVDDAAREMARHVARLRIEEKGGDTRVVAAGDQLVVEFGGADEFAALTAELLERVGKLDVRAGDATVIDAASIQRAGILEDGVAVDTTKPPRVDLGADVSFALDGKVRATGRADRVTETGFHVASSDPSMLRDVIEAGAVHPLHVTSRTHFTRATGFLPRAWPFLAIALALAAVGAVMRRKA